MKNSVHCDADKIPGWNKELELAFSAYEGPYTPGRVASRHKTVCEVLVSGAVVQAVEDGLIPEERLTSYHRLTEKLIFQSKKQKLD